MNKKLQKRWYLLVIGLVGIIAADYLYPPLDENPPLILSLCLFFLPVVLQIVIIVRKRLAHNLGLLRRAYLYCGSVLILLAALLGLNGLADRAPVRQVQTCIARKYITSGKYTTGYHLLVSSWRPDKNYETLRVSEKTYHSTFLGEAIVVEVHRGLFAMPWYSRVLPE